MRNRFDQLAKQIGQEALRTSGTTVAHDEINSETQYAAREHGLPDPEEQEFIMVVLKTWEERRAEARAEGRNEGRIEGRIEVSADSVLIVLQARGIAVPDAVRERILAQRDLGRLKRWLERATVATSLADVFDDPS